MMRRVCIGLAVVMMTILSVDRVQAQADLEVSGILTPIPGSQIDTGQLFDVSFSLTNVGTVPLATTETLDISLHIDTQLIGSVSFSPPAELTQNNSITYTLTNVPALYMGWLDMCVEAYWSQDQNPNNNTICETYFFVPEAVTAIEETAVAPEPLQSVWFDGANLQVRGAFAQPQNQAYLTVIDALGQVVATRNLSNQEGEWLETIGLPGSAHGMYFLSLNTAEGRLATRKFVVR